MSAEDKKVRLIEEALEKLVCGDIFMVIKFDRLAWLIKQVFKRAKNIKTIFLYCGKQNNLKL